MNVHLSARKAGGGKSPMNIRLSTRKASENQPGPSPSPGIRIANKKPQHNIKSVFMLHVASNKIEKNLGT